MLHKNKEDFAIMKNINRSKVIINECRNNKEELLSSLKVIQDYCINSCCFNCMLSSLCDNYRLINPRFWDL